MRSAAAGVVLLLVAPAAWSATLQIGFSPEGSARELVLDVIRSSQHTLDVMAYSLTAHDIARALLKAQARGVRVRVVADQSESRGRYMRRVLAALEAGGVAVRIDGNYKIQHDKVLISDGETVETGSFNYSYSAEVHNSENAVVMWNDPAVASAFEQHFTSRWNQAVPVNRRR